MSNTKLLTKRPRTVSRSSSSAFSVPVTPDRLKLFTDYGYLSKEKTVAVDFLSYLLSKTQLTTQKIVHGDIQDIGESIHKNILKKCHNDKINAVKEAIIITNEQAEIRLQNELDKAAKIASERRLNELNEQKLYYEDLALRTSKNRDSLENEKINKLILKKENEKHDALKIQWKKAERLKEECLERALMEQRNKLRAEAALSREIALADALRIARERFSDKLEREIERTKELCEKIADEEIEKLKQIQHHEVTQLRERIVEVEEEMKDMAERMKRAQRDYWEMENEYCHFLDYTSHNDVKSDFLLSPRKFNHGKLNSNKEKNVQTGLISLGQGTKTVQTDIKYHQIS